MTIIGNFCFFLCVHSLLTFLDNTERRAVSLRLASYGSDVDVYNQM